MMANQTSPGLVLLLVARRVSPARNIRVWQQGWVAVDDDDENWRLEPTQHHYRGRTKNGT